MPHSRNLLVTAILVLLISGCTETPPEPQTFQYVVYNEEQPDGNYEVMMGRLSAFTPMKIEGQESDPRTDTSFHLMAIRNISNSPGLDWAYHCHNERIYFVSDRDTTRMHYFLHYSDDFGETVHKLSDIRLSDSWLDSRRNGTELIINPHPSVDSAFYIINLEGEVLSKIKHPYAKCSDPSFSPDETQVVFSASPRRSKGTATLHDELFVMNDNGTDLRQLTVYPDGDTTAMWFEYHAGQPIWEPNANRISYLSKQNGSMGIHSVHPLSVDNFLITEGAFNHGWHNWSDDGTMLFHDGCDTTASPNYDIYMMQVNTGRVHRLTFDSLYQQAPLFLERTLVGDQIQAEMEVFP